MKISIVSVFLLTLFIVSCGHSAVTPSERSGEGGTPVTVTHPVIGDLSETITLNAASRFLLKTSVKSDLNGYIQSVRIHLGQRVSRGEELFVIRSKESEHLGDALTKLDTALHFTGTSSVRSPSDGYITDLSYKAGDYVQDNETLATISDASSLVFVLELPYELISSLPDNLKPDLQLPDGKIIKGVIGASLPSVNPASQTVSYIIKVSGSGPVPENLAATVKFIRRSKLHAAVLPKGCLLTDEAQSGFWIMKMTDSSTAVKVPVKIGLATSDKVEITSPVLQPADMILLEGNYGLPDTAKVVIEAQK